MKPIVINLDFDGTCTTHTFPEIGKDIGAVPVLKELVQAGHKLILFTMRSDMPEGDYLTQAVTWFKYHEIPLYGINVNPTQHIFSTSPKSYANLMIDDSALGVPLIYNKAISSRPFVDWFAVRGILKSTGVLPFKTLDPLIHYNGKERLILPAVESSL